MRSLQVALARSLGGWSVVAVVLFFAMWAAGDVYLWQFCGRPAMLWIFPLFQWVAT